jgi:hypothetical protein
MVAPKAVVLKVYVFPDCDPVSNLCILYPPAIVTVPPVGRAGLLKFCLTSSAIAPKLPTPLFSEVGPKVPLKLLTNGI